VGGIRQKGVIQTYARRGRRLGLTYLGELDGNHTPRLVNISIALAEACLDPQPVADMDAWLKSHAAVVTPLALAIYAAGGDNFRLARTPDGLALAVQAIKEMLGVLEALGIPLTPPAFGVLRRLPAALLVAILRTMMNTQAAQIAIAGHANAARDEMADLTADLEHYARLVGLPTPAFDRLRAYLDPEQAAIPEGSSAIAVDLRPAWLGLGLLMGLLAWQLFKRFRKSS
jgi:2-dehydropantoate 2-reductase